MYQKNNYHLPIVSKTMRLQALLSTGIPVPDFRAQCYHRSNGVALHASCSGRHRRRTVSASGSQSSTFNAVKKRKVVEHICLLKAKRDLSEKDENDMLDYLYTSQYQMRGIVAISLGRISSDIVENYTHAVVMRFERKEDVTRFYENPFYLKVLKEHVMPHCQEILNVDYESEVEDDILSIFRKGEEFNYGVEFLHLIAFSENPFAAPAKEALTFHKRLTEEFPSLIVQSTQGSNFNTSSQEYTHGLVTRFRSFEAFEMFMGSTEYKETWKSKFEHIIKKTLPIHYSVDPVGKELM
ncbi:stress-response A/B barrel domain-containing protein UP3 [Mercurialis annua]|uniref:stress-response A/B barrel domain-containing protein UP3 n=1 Tax=Mercurialis annua TaxID=3986 RepID=UPI00215FF9B8|nr:stress-response A/B barrel domain-containing protein UP3 [Mercurialis annua]